MPFPLHTLNLYQKPKLGNSFIKRIPVYNYKHSINAIGGFDSASCDIAIRSRDEGQQFLDQYLGNRVAFYVDNPVEPIWEGFINRMSFSAGGVQYSIGLDEMANRVAIQYTLAGVTAATETAISNDTNSQAVYGIKQSTVDAGPQATAGSGILTAFRGTILAQRAWPKTSILPSQGGSGLLHIELLGFYHTLEWDENRDTNNALNAINVNFTVILLPSVANGTTFFDNTDFSRIAANASTINRNSLRGENIWNRLVTLAEMGDGTNYYAMGVSPTNFQTGTRILYYQQANSTIVYTARQADGLRIRNLYGQLVDPWRVQPDNGIRVSDMLINWNGVGDNPTETYIKKIDYDANRQSCIYSGDDDLSAEGAFNLKRVNKAQKPGVGSAGRRLA